jgi:predicted RNA-binding protein YlxR (DUF448 family)
MVCFVVVTGQVTAVRGRRRPSGRGAWLCRRLSCFDAAVKARAFHRAFRSEVRPPVREAMEAVVETKTSSFSEDLTGKIR